MNNANATGTPESNQVQVSQSSTHDTTTAQALLRVEILEHFKFLNEHAQLCKLACGLNDDEPDIVSGDGTVEVNCHIEIPNADNWEPVEVSAENVTLNLTIAMEQRARDMAKRFKQLARHLSKSIKTESAKLETFSSDPLALAQMADLMAGTTVYAVLKGDQVMTVERSLTNARQYRDATTRMNPTKADSLTITVGRFMPEFIVTKPGVVQ